ncbi:hypothetical protein CRV00_01640 [Malaciobacter molluscorum]|nr:hypothetical protein CRV00_01640 [Malaciobacter molluscorum]
MKKLFFLIFCLSCMLYATQIKQYKVVTGSFFYKDTYYSFLRSFYKNEKKYFLVVNEENLKTRIFKLSELSSIILADNTNTKYKKLLKKYNTSFKLQNFGVTSIKTNKVYLTADLCPSSKKGYEDEFIKFFISRYYENSALNITFFVSGNWIKKHKDDFLELIRFQKQNKLNITWGNHTLTHYYNSSLPLNQNFLLKKGTNLKEEILNVEKILIENDVLPSILFRFPGLVSNEKIAKYVNTLGLIPVGSNAWLAKEQDIHDGSIILIHGNKNEPLGIKKAISIFKKNNFIFGSILNDLK